METKKHGRPYSRFKPEVISEILQDISEMVPYKHAAESQGVAECTFYKWIRQGVKDLKDESESDHARLVQSLRNIEKERIKLHTRQIAENDKSHRGAEWILERVFWKHFSPSASVIEFNERLERLEQSKDIDQEEDSNDKDNSESTQENTEQ